MTDVATTNGEDSARKLTLLRAIGLDRVSPEQRELALNIAQRYELDLLMKHLVLIDGRPYITRDGLLHVAHRSGKLDGIETTEPAIIDGFWRATASVYRNDMSHAFTYTGRYPTSGGNAKFAPEMAVKVAEVMALRRAFDVAAPTAEERWDAEVPAEPPAPVPSLAERAAARAAIVVEPAVQEAPAEPPVEAEAADGEALGASPSVQPVVDDTRNVSTASVQGAPAPSNSGSAPATTGTTCDSQSPYGDGKACALPAGHKGLHRLLGVDGLVVGSWPTT